MRTVKIGVIGCGEISQWMHLPFLGELPGFQVMAACDISPKVVAYAAKRFAIERTFTDHHALLEQADVEAVLIATPIHSDIAVAAAQAGKHVLVEKPMALNLAEAEAMVEAAERAGVILMVAYMKRYDPGYLYGQRLMKEMRDVRLIRVHDINGPNAAFVRDVTATFRDRELEAESGRQLRQDMRRRIEVAIGSGHSEGVYRAYELIAGLASHDITILRGAFGSPAGVRHTEIWGGGNYILSTFDYGDERKCVFEIGSMQRKGFDEELAAFGLHRAVRIRFPSPYIKYAPTTVHVTEQEGDAMVERTVTASHEEAFRRELEHFHTCLVEKREPVTSGREGLEDVRLQIAIIRALLES